MSWWRRRRARYANWVHELVSCKDPVHEDLPGEIHVLAHPHRGEPWYLALSRWWLYGSARNLHLKIWWHQVLR